MDAAAFSLNKLVSEWQERWWARVHGTKRWLSSGLYTQPTSTPPSAHARQNPARMPPPKRKGIAAVKKAPSKYIEVDSDSEHGSESDSERVSHNTSEEKEAPQAASTEQKQSPPNQQRPSRQETGSKVTPVAGQSTLAQTLFNGNEDNIHDDPDIIPPDIVQSIEPPTDSPPPDPGLHAPQQSTSRFDSATLKCTSLSSPADSRTLTTNRPSAFPKRKTSVRDEHPNTTQIETTNPNVNMANSGNYIPNSQARHMRACMVCSIVRTYTAFLQSGCPNCDGFLELTGNGDAIQDCTSQVFEGLLTVSNTSRSWVARYQRLEGYVPGVYAVQVEGILPEDAVVAAEQAGVHYIPRDGSVSEALPTEGM
jgi:transcription elongation factor SPT4